MDSVCQYLHRIIVSHSFMAKVKADSIYHNDDNFILKLPFCCGGQHKGKKISFKTAKGFSQILKRIQEFLNHKEVVGYIPFAILQPRIKDNSEAKVIIVYRTRERNVECNEFLFYAKS